VADLAQDLAGTGSGEGSALRAAGGPLTSAAPLAWLGMGSALRASGGPLTSAAPLAWLGMGSALRASGGPLTQDLWGTSSAPIPPAPAPRARFMVAGGASVLGFG
jgi:hypothetical protein